MQFISRSNGQAVGENQLVALVENQQGNVENVAHDDIGFGDENIVELRQQMQEILGARPVPNFERIQRLGNILNQDAQENAVPIANQSVSRHSIQTIFFLFNHFSFPRNFFYLLTSSVAHCSCST